jgi:hypothetical protein
MGNRFLNLLNNINIIVINHHLNLNIKVIMGIMGIMNNSIRNSFNLIIMLMVNLMLN